MDDNDNTRLIDSEMNRMLQTNDTDVQLPQSLLTEESPVIKAYAVLVSIAKSSNITEVQLPPRDTRAILYGVNHSRVNEIEMRLHELGWITITNLNQPGMSVRRRIIVKYNQLRLINDRIMFEMVERLKMYTGNAGKPELALHKIYY